MTSQESFSVYNCAGRCPDLC